MWSNYVNTELQEGGIAAIFLQMLLQFSAIINEYVCSTAFFTTSTRPVVGPTQPSASWYNVYVLRCKAVAA